MKYILFFLLFISTSIYSQSIDINKVNQDGSRIISTDGYFIRTGFTDRTPFLFSIKSYVNPDKTISFYLGLRINSVTSITIPKNGIILFKTLKGNVIECKQQLDDYKTEDIIGTFVPIAGMTIHSANGLYSITENDLNILCTEGIIKVRVETDIKNIDAEYSDKKGLLFSYNLKSRLNLIYNISKQNSNIRDGF